MLVRLSLMVFSSGCVQRFFARVVPSNRHDSKTTLRNAILKHATEKERGKKQLLAGERAGGREPDGGLAALPSQLLGCKYGLLGHVLSSRISENCWPTFVSNLIFKNAYHSRIRT